MLVAGFWLSLSMLSCADLGKGTKAGIPRETGASRLVLCTSAETKRLGATAFVTADAGVNLGKTRTSRANDLHARGSPRTDCSCRSKVRRQEQSVRGEPLACRSLALLVRVLPKFTPASAVTKAVAPSRLVSALVHRTSRDAPVSRGIPAFVPFPRSAHESMLRESQKPATSIGGRHESTGRGPHHPGGHTG